MTRRQGGPLAVDVLTLGVETYLVNKLIERRIELGLSIAEVARRVGITRQTAWQWESQIVKPHNFTKWQRWAAAVESRLIIDLKAR